MRRIEIVSACCLTFLAVCACTGTLHETGAGVQGEVTLDLTAEQWTRPVSKSQTVESGIDNSVSPDDFTVEIFRTDGPDGDVRIFREPYADVKGRTIGLNGGRFRLYAYYGEPDAAGFDAWYYAAEKEFEITSEERHVDLSAVARLSNVAVAVEFGENIAADYPDAYAEVSGGEDALLTFSQEETRVGYMPAGKLTVRVYATVDGELRYFEYRPADGDDVYEPNDFVTFRLDTAPGESSVSLGVSIDRETELIEKNVELPASMLPQEAPVINISGFEGGTSLEVTEAAVLPEQVRADITAGAGIAHCYLDIESEYLQKALGRSETSFRIDLVSVDGHDAEVLRANGFRWMRSMSGQRLAYVDFTGVAQMLAGRVYDAGNSFSARIKLTVEDMLPKPQSGVSEPYTIEEVAPEFSFDVLPADAWAKSIRGMEIGYAKGNPDVLKLQYRPASGGEWTDASLSSDSGSALSFSNITGLTPSTEYELRAIYNGNEATAVTARLTTEEAAQVGNSGFEEWTDAIHEVDGWSSTDKVNWYLPWKDASSAVWAVNSKVSMPDSYNAAYLSYKCHPTVSYLNTDAYEKTNYAQIVTVAVGAAASEWSNGTSYYGELFIGSATDDGKYETTGTTFHSRPDKLAFYYKYSSYEKEQFYVHAEVRKSDGTVIATAHTDAGPASVGWTRYEMPFTYSDSTSESASIFIAFRSTSSSSPKVRKMTIQEIGGSYTIHGGSILCVDDLQLIYE